MAEYNKKIGSYLLGCISLFLLWPITVMAGWVEGQIVSIENDSRRFIMDVKEGRIRGENLTGQFTFLVDDSEHLKGLDPGQSARVWIKGQKKEDAFVVNKIVVLDPDGIRQCPGQDPTGVRQRLMNSCPGGGRHGRGAGGGNRGGNLR
jgi:hypothetical protein